METEPQNMIETDFAVLSEDYSRYLVQDGTILKVKVVVKKILRTATVSPQGYPVGVGIDAINAVAAIVPPGLKRPPSKESWDPKKDVGQEMKFETLEEKWQSYMTNEGFRVLVKPIVTKIIKYDKYTNFGEPVYSTVIQSITNVEKLSSTAT